MAITVFESCKKRKRTPNIFTLPFFATMNSHGPFRTNIRNFIKRCAEPEDYTIGPHPVWCTLLVSESSGVVFPLYVVEQTVLPSPSSYSPLCDFCRFIGWSHHFVSKRNYHVIIPEDRKWSKAISKESLKLQTHLLHGVIHCNGFGHLLCLKMGSNSSNNYLTGEALMSIWDHFCFTLQTRGISVHDTSKEGSMDQRLLHGVAYGRSWFAKWGYKLSHGSFGVTRQEYNRALEILSSLDLSKIVCDFFEKRQGKLIEQIISTYRNVSDAQLVTISDLIQFMLAFDSKALIQRKTALALASISTKLSMETTHQAETHLHSHPSYVGSRSVGYFVAKLGATRWPKRRLEHVVKVIFQALESYEGGRMLRQDLRNAVRSHIGDTGLIDFVLKHIDKVIVGDKIIVRATKPTNKLLEFSLKNISDGATFERKTKKDSASDAVPLQPGLDVYKDLVFLYKNVLLGYPDCHAVSLAVRVILDSKHFVKEWQFKNSNEDAILRLICQVRPSYDELVNELTRPLPPGEVVVTPAQESTTVGELKLMVQCALRDTYCVMDKLVVKDIQIGEMVAMEDKDLIKCRVEQGMQVWVRGYGLDLGTKLRYQGGDNDWTVNCRCGAKDDDGERMVACDVCHVWQHTRCNNINDDDAPPLFLCRFCSSRMKKNKLAAT